MIVMIGGIKGGTGKSTIATNLAVYLANHGADVLLLDVDPQATAYKWAMRRQKNYQDAPKVNTAQASGRVFDVVRDVSKRYEHIVIDSGGHASDAMKSAMLGVQKLYVPLRPSQADLETVGEMVSMVADVKALNSGLQALSLVSLASQPILPSSRPRKPVRRSVMSRRSLCPVALSASARFTVTPFSRALALSR